MRYGLFFNFLLSNQPLLPQHERMKSSVAKFLNQDQIKLMINEKRNNQPWSNATIGRCFQILAKLGSSSYEYLRSLAWPLVSLRTLQERASAIRFLPGPLPEFMDILGQKVDKDPLGLLAMMSFDEMVLRYRKMNCVA
jgi:Transposase protein